MGDFNEILKAEEKFGRLDRPETQMQQFRDVVDACGFMDLGFTGPRFTWTNNRPRDMTWERLDRVLGHFGLAHVIPICPCSPSGWKVF
jgi:hypothetical protein